MTINPDAKFEGEQLLEINEREMAFARGIYFEGNMFKGMVLSDHELVESELPMTKPQSPTLATTNKTGYFTAGVESPKFRATNYKAEAKYEVLINGRLLNENEYVIEIESPFSFVVELQPVYAPGAYTLVLREMDGKQTVRDIVTFNITVSEDKGER